MKTRLTRKSPRFFVEELVARIYAVVRRTAGDHPLALRGEGIDREFNLLVLEPVGSVMYRLIIAIHATTNHMSVCH
jgi:hypothetical protein